MACMMYINTHLKGVLGFRCVFDPVFFLLNFPNSINPFASQIYIIIFDQQCFLLYSILLGDLLHKQSIFHIAVNCLIKCSLNDPRSNYFPLKFPKP